MLNDRPILTLAVSQTLVWAGLFYIFPASLLRWELALGWSKPELTLAITLATLASAAGSPIAGRIIDAGRGPALMGLATATGGLGIVALSQVTELWQFYAVWLAVGLMLSGSLYDACFALVTHTRGAEAKRGIVVITLVAGFAGTVAFPAVHVLAEALGWRAATAIMGGAVIAVVAPMQYLGARALQRGRVPPPPRDGAAEAGHAFLRRPVFWLLGLGWAMLALTHGATLHHLLSILAERGIAPGTAVLAASGIGPMQVAGRIAMVATQRYLSHAAYALIAFAAMGGAVLLLNLAGSNIALVFAFVLLFGSAWGTVSILRPVLARELLGETNFGAKSGSLALIFLTAAAGSAYLGALIWAAGGYGLMLAVLTGLAAVGALFFTAATRLAVRAS